MMDQPFASLFLTFSRMLEDPSYSEIVRWGDEGDSFVVLEVILLGALRSFPPATPG